MADSSTGSYLNPALATPPLEDLDLDAEFQKAVVGITGLAGNLVRPRWQATPPKQPEPSVNWCSIGVTSQVPDAGPLIDHVGIGNGTDELQRHEDIVLESTFYGPLGQRYAALFRDGLGLPQNMEGLSAVLISLTEVGEIVTAPELFNQQWIRRFDITVKFRRQVKRTYTILNVLYVDPVLSFEDVGGAPV
jgi:hypothetical protein